MYYNPHPDYAEYIEANKHGFIDVWNENGETKTKLITDHEPTEAELKAVELRMKILLDYKRPEGMTIENKTICVDGNPRLPIRIYRPAGLPSNAPVLMEVHGGGWIGGSLDIDDSRAVSLAQGTPCIVVSVDYRICRNGVHYPDPLMDCLGAYLYLCKRAGEIGGDPEKIAIHGTSAGGNLCAGLALYLRDHGLPTPRLTAINCPALYIDGAEHLSAYQYTHPMKGAFGNAQSVISQYLGGFDGTVPSYYAMPGLCPDLSGLGPHAVIAAEYDALRDDAIRYATRLLNSAVPCELIVAPRVCHAYCAVDAALTDWTHQSVCMSLRREFARTE